MFQLPSKRTLVDEQGLGLNKTMGKGERTTQMERNNCAPRIPHERLGLKLKSHSASSFRDHGAKIPRAVEEIDFFPKSRISHQQICG
jgi:hypothetical protein